MDVDDLITSIAINALPILALVLLAMLAERLRPVDPSTLGRPA